MMQAELENIGSPVEIRILGVNEAGHESGNAQNCEGRVIPWLQDTPEEKAWSDWQVTFRDVVILDPENVPVGVYNLTTYNLGESANYDSLKTLLIELAEEAGE